MEYIIDSNARDKTLYPSPCKFRFPIPDIYGAVTGLTLNGLSVPRSETNVNSGNYIIPFNISDSVSSLKITGVGYGYVPGVYRSDNVNNYVTVSNPGIFTTGNDGEINLSFENSILSSVSITNPGKYLFDGRYDRTITETDVGAEAGATSAVITIVVENNVISDVLIKDAGNGWLFGLSSSGSSTYATDVLFRRSGSKAIVEVTIGSNSSISTVTIEDAGTGYVRGTYNDLAKGCEIYLNIPTQGTNITKGSITAEVGEIKLATLRYGQYAIDYDHDALPGLCREVTRALQKASSAEFFPYSSYANEVLYTTGSCSIVSSNPNATLSKKIVIRRGEALNSNGNGAFLELLFGTYTDPNSASSLLGYGATNVGESSDSICSLINNYTLYGDAYTLPDPQVDFKFQDIGVRSNTIFNLNDTPNYLVVKILGNESFKKFRSNNDQIDSGSFIATFKTGVDNVFSNINDSQMLKMEILGDHNIVVNPPSRMTFLDIEIIKPNGNLYGTQRDVLLVIKIDQQIT